MKAWLAVALAIVFALVGCHRHAPLSARDGSLAARSQDLVTGANETLAVPPLPMGWVTVLRGPLEVSYPPAIARLVQPSLASASHAARSVGVPFGWTVRPPLRVRLVRDTDEMRRLAPAEAPPPLYAEGVAYPALGLALIAAMGPRSQPVDDMPRVLRHELSHLVLGQATGNATIPRWLSEGVAVQQSGEQSFERFETLARATFTRGVLPLSRLDAAFEGAPAVVDEAYAQSADFVGYLLRGDGSTRFAILLAHLRSGENLDAATRDAYGHALGSLEGDWRRDLSSRFALAPLWAGSGFVSLAGLVLVAVAMIRRHRRSQNTLRRWAQEDRLRAFRRGLRVVRADVETPDGHGQQH